MCLNVHSYEPPMNEKSESSLKNTRITMPQSYAKIHYETAYILLISILYQSCFNPISILFHSCFVKQERDWYGISLILVLTWINIGIMYAVYEVTLEYG